MKLVLTSFAVGLGIVACSGSSTGGSNGGAAVAGFVGSWSCILDGDSGALTAAFTIAESSDGSLTVSGGGDSGTFGSCTTNQLSVSGSIASVPPNDTCSDGPLTVTVKSMTFTLNGSTLTFSEDLTLGTGAGSASLIAAGPCAKD